MTLLILGIALWSAVHLMKRLTPGARAGLAAALRWFSLHWPWHLPTLILAVTPGRQQSSCWVSTC